jgi:hypothetical protein
MIHRRDVDGDAIDDEIVRASRLPAQHIDLLVCGVIEIKGTKQTRETATSELRSAKILVIGKAGT